MEIIIPDYEDKKLLQKFLFENQVKLKAQKKSITKHADGIGGASVLFANKKGANKADTINIDEVTELMVKVVINTTNVIDSHMDLHVDGIWNKTVKENKNIMHVQEHKSYEFKSIISDGDDLSASVVKYNWSDLGYDFKGTTEALQFDSNVKKERNEYMFTQYAKGRVKNHSVGMRYVNLIMCIDNKDYGAEFEAWEKYIQLAVNPEVAENKGFFWAVKEAKAIEGSAVPLGSNYITPTISVGENKQEPFNDTLANDAAAKALQLNQFYKHLKL